MSYIAQQSLLDWHTTQISEFKFTDEFRNSVAFSSPLGVRHVRLRVLSDDARSRLLAEVTTTAKKAAVGRPLSRRIEYRQELAKLACNVVWGCTVGKIPRTHPRMSSDRALAVTDFCLFLLMPFNADDSSEFPIRLREQIFEALTSSELEAD